MPPHLIVTLYRLTTSSVLCMCEDITANQYELVVTKLRLAAPLPAGRSLSKASCAPKGKGTPEAGRDGSLRA